MPRLLGPALMVVVVSLLIASLLDQNLSEPNTPSTPSTRGMSRTAIARAKLQQPQRPRASERAADTRVVVLDNTHGHFATEARIDGRSVDFLVDTGASLVTLRASEAASLGYNPREEDYRVRISTANGEGRAARIELETIEVGEISVRNVPAFVVADNALQVNLLGMSFLSRVRFHHDGRQLILEQ
jgi:aspartyl protease family protein